MKHRRYGKFRFRDYISAWIAVALLLVLMVLVFLTDTPFYMLIFPLLLLTFMVWSIYKPNSECFWLSGDIITIAEGGKTRDISMPSELTIIISYADVCSPFAKRISYGNQTYMLKGRYSISILQKMPLEDALMRLHQNYTRKYTNTTVEMSFDEHLYIYGFVGNQEILDHFLTNKNCRIIIPETLFNQISISSHQTNIHIDVGY